jgi:hypothetical protein
MGVFQGSPGIYFYENTGTRSLANSECRIANEGKSQKAKVAEKVQSSKVKDKRSRNHGPKSKVSEV